MFNGISENNVSDSFAPGRTIARSLSLSPRSVAVLGGDGVRACDLFGPIDVLGAARFEVKQTMRRCYDITVVGITSKSFNSEIGVACKADEILNGPSSFDTMIVPGGRGMREGENLRRAAEWLASHSHSIRRIVTIGTGIYPVAQAGLVKGRKIVTHWRFSHDVAKRFPELRIDQTVPFARDGRFYSCGGGTAPMELALALIDEDFGLQSALPVARDSGLRLRPFGDNRECPEVGSIEYGPSDRLDDLPAWMAAHLDEKLSVEELAERACVCPRHFRRLFKDRFKTTPSAFLEKLRLDEARHRLIATRSSIDSISRSVGFQYVNSFRRAFERRYGRNPLAFRHEYQANGARRPTISKRSVSLPIVGMAYSIQ